MSIIRSCPIYLAHSYKHHEHFCLLTLLTPMSTMSTIRLLSRSGAGLLLVWLGVITILQIIYAVLATRDLSIAASLFLLYFSVASKLNEKMTRRTTIIEQTKASGARIEKTVNP